MQSDVAQCAQLRESHVLSVLIARPTRQLHIQERQIILVEHCTILVDQRRHLRLVYQCGRLVRGIIAPLVPQHARHMETLQWRDMVSINGTTLHMVSNRRTTPCSLNNTGGYIRMRGTKLHGELLCQIAEMLRIIGGRIKPGIGLLVHVA